MTNRADSEYDLLLDLLGGDHDDQLIEMVAANPHMVNSSDSETGETILHEAAYIGRLATVQRLLDLGAKIDDVGNLGRSPLHYAAMGGHMNVVEELVKRGCQVEIKDDSGMTPLIYASISGPNKCETVELLLDHGATLDLETAIRMERSEAASSIIEADEGWLHQLRCPGRTLATVIARRNLPILKLLLEHGMPVDAKDQSGNTALCHACSDGAIPLEIVSLLLQHSANPNGAENRQSPIQRARRVGRDDVIILLQRFGATQ